MNLLKQLSFRATGPSKALGGDDSSSSHDGAGDAEVPSGQTTPNSSVRRFPDPNEALADVDEEKITAEDEPEDDPVRVELEKQVRERDKSISVAEKARAEKASELKQLEDELAREKLLQMKAAIMHKIEMERIKQQTEFADERLKALEHDMQDKAAITEYANLIKGVAPKGGVDSQYVMKLQSQLQKAVMKMETTTQRTKELEVKYHEEIDSLSRNVTDAVEDRCRIEIELRQQIEVMVEQKREMKVTYETRIKENEQKLHDLREKAADEKTIEDLEEELMETETQMTALNKTKQKNKETIDKLKESLPEWDD